jgi:hypothetical protein
MSSGRRGLGEDDGTAGQGTAWVNGIAWCTSGTVWVHSVAGSVRTTLLRAQKWRRVLGDEACVVDGVTGSGQGRWRGVRASTVVRNDGADAPGRTR